MDVSSGDGTIKVDQDTALFYPFIYNFDSGATVTVEAVPSFAHVFDGWSGDLSGTTNPAVLQIDCNKNITASFYTDWTLVIAGIVSLVIVGLLVTAVLIRRRADGTIRF